MQNHSITRLIGATLTIFLFAGGAFKPDFGLSGDVHTSELVLAPKYRHIRQHGFLLREALRDSTTKSLDFTCGYTAILTYSSHANRSTSF